MASMSYCMFENTAAELDQVVDAMKEAITWGDLDLNEYEKSAKERLYNLCEAYINQYKRLEEASQYEDEDEE